MLGIQEPRRGRNADVVADSGALISTIDRVIGGYVAAGASRFGARADIVSSVRAQAA